MTTDIFCRKCTTLLPQNAVYCHICGTKQQPDKRVRSRANGMGTAYKRGKTWTAQLRVKAKDKFISYTKGGFTKKSDALEYRAKLILAQAEGERTLEHYWTIYRENKLPKLSSSKQTAYKIAYNKLEALALKPIGTIGIKRIQDTVNKKAPSYYPARDIKMLLSHICKLALGDGVISTNISELIELPALVEKESKPFTTEEQAALWEKYATGDIFVGYLLLMIHSGMMPGELMACRKDNIQWDIQQITGCGKKTKTRKETPIMVADYIIPVLHSLCDFSAGDKLLTMNKDNFYKAYYATLERCGCRKLPPYACRHTTGTVLGVDRNTSPVVIAKVLRQKSLTIQERYIHPEIGDALDAVNGMRILETI